MNTRIVSLVLIVISASASAYDEEPKQFAVHGAYVFAQASYSLDGQGFAVNTGSVTGRGLAAHVGWNRTERRIAFDYWNVGIEPSTPSTLSPSKTKAGIRRYLLSFQPRTEEGYEGGSRFMIDYGIEVRQRSADSTTPNEYLPNHDSTGVRFGFEYPFSIATQTAVETGAGIYIPLYLDERGAKTGHYKFSVNPDLKVALVHEIAGYLAMSAGISVLYEQIFYSGTGDRGTSAASESFLNIHFPLELRFQF